MKRLVLSLNLCALALLAAACASPQLKKTPAWEQAAKDPLAADARAGRFHLGMKQAMGAAEYMFETEGFLWSHRDDDAKSFLSEVIKEGEPGEDENLLQVTFTQEANGVVSAKWIHFKIIKYKNVDQCLEKPDCDKELSDDWNWRLYKVARKGGR